MSIEKNAFTAFVAPAIGVALANMMFFSPLRAVLSVRRTQDLGVLNPLPFLAISVNTAAWLVYSSVTRDW